MAVGGRLVCRVQPVTSHVLRMHSYLQPVVPDVGTHIVDARIEFFQTLENALRGRLLYYSTTLHAYFVATRSQELSMISYT